MNAKYKKTILIDLDGVLNEYQDGFDPNSIPKPKAGVEKFLKQMTEKFELKLFTTRNKLLASKWLTEHGPDKYFTDITDRKICAGYLLMIGVLSSTGVLKT